MNDAIILFLIVLYCLYFEGFIKIEFIVISLFLTLRLERFRRFIIILSGRALEANVVISLLGLFYLALALGVIEFSDILHFFT